MFFWCTKNCCKPAQCSWGSPFETVTVDFLQTKLSLERCPSSALSSSLSVATCYFENFGLEIPSPVCSAIRWWVYKRSCFSPFSPFFSSSHYRFSWFLQKTDKRTSCVFCSIKISCSRKLMKCFSLQSAKRLNFAPVFPVSQVLDFWLWYLASASSSASPNFDYFRQPTPVPLLDRDLRYMIRDI